MMGYEKPLDELDARHPQFAVSKRTVSTRSVHCFVQDENRVR